MNLIFDQTRRNKLTTDLYFAGVTRYSDLVSIPLDGIIPKRSCRNLHTFIRPNHAGKVAQNATTGARGRLYKKVIKVNHS